MADSKFWQHVKAETFKSVYKYFYYEEGGFVRKIGTNDVWAYRLIEVRPKNNPKKFVIETHAMGWIDYGAAKVLHQCWTTFEKTQQGWFADHTECERIAD